MQCKCVHAMRSGVRLQRFQKARQSTQTSFKFAVSMRARARSTRSCVYSTVLKYASMNAEMSQKWSHVKLLPLHASTACQCIMSLALIKCCAAGTCIAESHAPHRRGSCEQ